MKTGLLDARGTARVLRRMIGEHDRIRIAVAWGYNGPLADLLLENRDKFVSVIFGLNGFATSPDLIDRLVKMRGAYVAKAASGIFHPKIYYFESEDMAEAIVGSANFTNGGLGRNFETSVHFRGSPGEEIFGEIRATLGRCEALRQSVTEKLAQSYRRQHDIACASRGPRNPVLPEDGKDWDRLNAPLAIMEWDVFAARARRDRYHGYDRRISLLRAVQRRFAATASFRDMSVFEWKAICGTIGEVDKAVAKLDDHEWGWFGSMGGNGDFANRVGERNSKLAEAVDAIPRSEEVTQGDYEQFCKAFEKAFAGAHHGGGVPTASRLLAMKRPDQFVCVNGKNRVNMAKALAFAPTTLSLESYWERVIEPIRLAPWYNAPRPNDENRDLWDYRAAMLDAIYYDAKA